jgi:hypothetical protein
MLKTLLFFYDSTDGCEEFAVIFAWVKVKDKFATDKFLQKSKNIFNRKN